MLKYWGKYVMYFEYIKDKMKNKYFKYIKTQHGLKNGELDDM